MVERELVIPSRRIGAVELFKVNQNSEILERFSVFTVQLDYEESRKEQDVCLRHELKSLSLKV